MLPLKLRFVYLVIFLLCPHLPTGALLASVRTPDAILEYKEVDSEPLNLFVFFPVKADKSAGKPAIVFFHGGGWKKGGPSQFYRQSEYLSSLGMVAINVQYRTEESHGTTPIESVKDALSAMRWVRKNSEKLGIDPNRISAGGGSAGGHLALACALVKGFEDTGELAGVSPVPNALILFNPILDTSSQGYGATRLGDLSEQLSPLHQIRPGAPPALILLGTEDQLIPVDTAKEFETKMIGLGIRCETVLYEGQKHGFFNKEKYEETLQAAVEFLISLNYLEPQFSEDDVEIEKGGLIYENKLANETSVEGWIMEGPGEIVFIDGWMEMHSPNEEFHHVFWFPAELPGDFVAEWDAQNLKTEAGLCIVFFSARAVSGVDIFDPSLSERNGDFKQYTNGDINSYHISYYANPPFNPDRGRANLRKNNMFALLQSGKGGIAAASNQIHRLKLVKQQGHIRFYVDGQKVIDYNDNDQLHGPLYGAGKLGFRQMQWTHFRYRNLKVWEIN